MVTNISPETDQIRAWGGAFGQEYTDRNNFTPAQLDDLYRKTYGVTRRELNQRLLAGVPKQARILEVGCNMGTQLLLLKEMGFTQLAGIEIQSYALGRARERIPDAQLLQASALSIPFEDNQFDLVFTSGVLIHIAAADLPVAMAEIHRCTKQWIWGFEYYAPQMTEVVYRGGKGLLWKADYAHLYLEQFEGLKLIWEERLRYVENENVDTAFLLRKE